MDELESLAESAGYSVVGRMEQVRQLDPNYQIGSGKVRELAELIKKTGAQRIIFDNRLKPLQAYNLAKTTRVEVIDRFQLILEIFAKRATTTEAKMQIQLARLEYELIHAKQRVRLSRMSEQPGFMGLGAYEVDVYYKTVKRQVHNLQKKLEKKQRTRRLHRKRRLELGFLSISLAGYTNAGKSLLFNTLTGEENTVDEMLFTTLSTTTRLVKFAKKKLLLTDTVGFIDRLPLTLIEAFNSTLEETVYADLILLVIDFSEPIAVIEKKLAVCYETIKQIGATGIPLITALNKIDLLSEKKVQNKLDQIKGKVTKPIPISALYKSNLDLLTFEVRQMLKKYVRASFKIPLQSETMSIISWLFQRADVKAISYRDGFAHVVFEARPWFAEKVKNRIEESNGIFKKKYTEI